MTEHLIDDFASFAKGRLAAGVSASIDDLYDEWRESHGAEEDRLALEASLRDMAAGETGRPFEEFSAEFREQNGLLEARV